MERFVAGGPEAERAIARWTNDRHKREVVPFVERAVTEFAYRVTPTMIEETAEETEHALGDIPSTITRAVPGTRDWHPAFAFEHVLHHALESLKSVPTFQTFREFCG